MNTTNNFRVGQKVLFGRTNGEQTLGEVVKVNPSTLKVKQLEARGTMRSYAIGTVWKVAPQFCKATDKEDVPAPLPVTSSTKRAESEVLSDIRSVYAQLSPENLSCDGELPMSMVRARHRVLTRKLTGLFQELGRSITESEAFGLK